MSDSGFLDRDEIAALGFAPVGARVYIDRSARIGPERCLQAMEAGKVSGR